MTHTQTMLESRKGSFGLDPVQLSTTIDRLIDCANTCTQCAMACLEEEAVGELTTCIQLNLDCADVCATTSRVVSRKTERDIEVTRALLRACIAACRSCGDECESHAAHMEHCRICADQCLRCEAACRSLLDALGDQGAS